MTAQVEAASPIQQINGWICPTGDPYYERSLREEMPDAKSIGAAMQVVLKRGEPRWAIDAGAHIGTWAKPLSGYFEHVVSIEPHPGLASLLRANLGPALGQNVRVIEAAVWRECGMVDLKAGGGQNSGQAHIADDGKSDDVLLRVPTITIDALELPGCDLIKLDVEGAEFDAIHGGETTIRSHRPVIVLEEDDVSYRFGRRRGSARELLEDWGMLEVECIEFWRGKFNLVMTWPEEAGRSKRGQ